MSGAGDDAMMSRGGVVHVTGCFDLDVGMRASLCCLLVVMLPRLSFGCCSWCLFVSSNHSIEDFNKVLIAGLNEYLVDY